MSAASARGSIRCAARTTCRAAATWARSRTSCPGFQDIERDHEARARFERGVETTIRPTYGWHLTQMFHGMERGELRTLYVIGENPAQSEADINQTRKLLAELDFLVVQDIVLTKTAEMADVVFPSAASWCETDGTVTNSERRVQRVRKALEPPGEARDDMWIIAELARRLGHDWPEPGRRGRLGRAAVALADARRDELRAPRGARRPPVAVPRRGASRLADPARAPLGRAARRPTGAVLGGRGARPVRGSSTPTTRSGSRPAVGSSRTTPAPRRTSTRSPLHRGESLDLSPEDAERLELADGEIARVSSRRGSVEAPVRIDPSLRPGLAFMTFHFPDQVDTNQLTIDATDPKSGTAEFKAAAIRVEKLEPAEREERAGIAEPATVGGQTLDGSPSRPRRRADAVGERGARHRARRRPSTAGTAVRASTVRRATPRARATPPASGVICCSRRSGPCRSGSAGSAPAG